MPVGKSFRVGWRRLGLGVEFGLDLGFLANWISVTPRLGLWQLDAVLPMRDENGEPLAIDYGFKTQASLGYRAAIEFASPFWTALRLTQGREVTSAALTPGGGASGAKTESYGVDVFFRGLAAGGTTIFPYLFLAREAAVFSLGKASEIDLVSKEREQNGRFQADLLQCRLCRWGNWNRVVRQGLCQSADLLSSQTCLEIPRSAERDAAGLTVSHTGPCKQTSWRRGSRCRCTVSRSTRTWYRSKSSMTKKGCWSGGSI